MFKQAISISLSVLLLSISAAWTADGGDHGTELAGGTCLADTYEPDEDVFPELSAGATQTRSLCPGTEFDFFFVDVPASSAVVIETAGANGDTLLTLLDPAIVQKDDDGGVGSFSRLEWTCGLEPLPEGTFFGRIEAPDDMQIAEYTLSYEVVELCPCPVELTLENDTIRGIQTHRAEETVTLGPSLDVRGLFPDLDSIRIFAGDRVVMRSGTRIFGSALFGTLDSPCPEGT
jgi:hypothetical protein